jgi:hypothetical protein
MEVQGDLLTQGRICSQLDTRDGRTRDVPPELGLATTVVCASGRVLSVGRHAMRSVCPWAGFSRNQVEHTIERNVRFWDSATNWKTGNKE